jgi:drug/metabolite transporter (DMT)-like permease
MVLSLVLVVFIPAFFAISSGEDRTSVIDLLLMTLIGIVTTYGVYAGMVAITIVKKRSNFLLFGTLAMAFVLFIYGIGTDGVTIIAILGMALAIFGTVVIYINETRKDERVDYSRTIPLIG